jgi:hypothetical protein
MKRRKFIRNLGLGLPPVLIAKSGVDFQNNETFPEYNYTQPSSLDEAVTAGGNIIIRLEFTGDSRELRKIEPAISVTEEN